MPVNQDRNFIGLISFKLQSKGSCTPLVKVINCVNYFFVLIENSNLNLTKSINTALLVHSLKPCIHT